MRLLLPLLLLFTVSCTSLTSDIEADSRTYHDANLRSFDTYQWDSAALLLADATGTWTGSGFDLGRAMKQAVDNELRAAGYSLLTSGAEVSVRLGAIGTRAQLEAARAESAETAETTIVTEGCLLVDIYRTGTGELLWRGVARSQAHEVYPREEVQKRVDYAVEQMFENFQH